MCPIQAGLLLSIKLRLHQVANDRSGVATKALCIHEASISDVTSNQTLVLIKNYGSIQIKGLNPNIHPNKSVDHRHPSNENYT